MRATFFSKALNFLPSPTRSARSRMVTASYGSNGGGPLPKRRRTLRSPFLSHSVGFAPGAPLVAVLLDLTRQVVRHQVDRVPHVRGPLAGAQRDALKVQGGLGDVTVPDGRVVLLPELDLQLRER